MSRSYDASLLIIEVEARWVRVEEDLQRSRRKKSENIHLDSSWFSFMIDFVPCFGHFSFYAFYAFFTFQLCLLVYFIVFIIDIKFFKTTTLRPTFFLLRCVVDTQTFLSLSICINHFPMITFVIIV